MNKFLLCMWIFNLVASVQAQQGMRCIQCASKPLQNLWYLTGFQSIDQIESSDSNLFPTSVTPNFDCATNKDPALMQQSDAADLQKYIKDGCDSGCVELLIDVPQTAYCLMTSSCTSAIATLAVRGCYSDLTGLMPDDINSDVLTESCSVDQHKKIISSTGDDIQVGKVWRVCKTDLCNDNILNVPAAQYVTANNLQNECSPKDSPVQCNECKMGPTGECEDTQGCSDGNWCYERQLTFNGDDNNQIVIKGCTYINPYGDEECQTMSDLYTFIPDQINMQTEVTVCYCASDFCNAAHTMIANCFLSTLMLFLIQYFFLKS